MRILGSGKIDDYQKIVLGDKVVRALNVKSGDSVLFYRGAGDRVEMFRAEGAQVTDECDCRPRIHLRGMRSCICAFALLALVFSALSPAVILLDIGTGAREIVFLGSVLSMVFCAGILYTVSSMDTDDETQRLISVGGPYSKDRLIGLSRLVSDSSVVTGNLYVNSLFGSNPSEIEVTLDFDSGNSALALTKCVKDVPGYSVHKIRVPSEGVGDGRMTLVATYVFSGKRIVATAVYRLSVKGPRSPVIGVEEDGFSAELVFDGSFQRSAFDESLFDPSDDDVII